MSVLDETLLSFTPNDSWTVRDACEGTQIFGALGSGKTSGSGQAIAKAFLRKGYGGLVLTAKPEEAALWERYCAETGRSEHLRIFAPGKDQRFNFMDYEMNRSGAGAGLTENLVGLFTTVLEVGSNQRQGGGSDPYWNNSLRQLLRNAIDLQAIATGSVSLPDVARIIASAPQKPSDPTSPSWQEGSYCYELLAKAQARTDKTPIQQRDYDTCFAYWANQFPALADKTRSIIVSSFTAMADGFLRGALYDLFCADTNLLPEMTHEGAILVLDLPIKEYGEVGRFAQVLFKHIWQQATERRNIEKHPRPTFLWADESQFFITSYDTLFQTTARSARACTVYLTQNISNYYAAMGGENSKAYVDSLLGNLQTKIFHANGDPVTNTWAADVFARDWSSHTSTTFGSSDSSTRSKSLDYQIEPVVFTTLSKGGPANGLAVEGLVFEAGKKWSTGKNHLPVVFDQRA